MSTPQTGADAALPTIDDRIGRRGVGWPTDAMGATQRGVQPIEPGGRLGEPDRAALESLAPGN